MSTNLHLHVARLSLVIAVAPAVAGDLTPAQKDAICRVSLARINGNAQGDYRNKGKVGDTTEYLSARGYTYYCEIFSEGKAFTLSSSDWGRLKPTGSVSTEGKCSNIKLFDPGFGVTHDLKSCPK